EFYTQLRASVSLSSGFHQEAVMQGSIAETVVGIYVVKHDVSAKPEDISIVLKDLMVVHDLDNSTFEIMQKLVMELDGSTLSKKAQALKNRLHI
uniref:Uncharacterized protein n=1 Tax=Seriola lalandi dorsalis TaxID=1841481 RepID=A0A3B4XW98_SERLL